MINFIVYARNTTASDIYVKRLSGLKLPAKTGGNTYGADVALVGSAGNNSLSEMFESDDLYTLVNNANPSFGSVVISTSNLGGGVSGNVAPDLTLTQMLNVLTPVTKNDTNSLITAATVFGGSYQTIQSFNDQSTASTGGIDVVNVNTTSLPNGNYIVIWSFEVNNNTSGQATLSRVTVNGTKITGKTGTGSQDGSDTLTFPALTGWVAVSGSRVIALSGVVPVTVHLATSVNTATAWIRNINIIIFRVS